MTIIGKANIDAATSTVRGGASANAGVMPRTSAAIRHRQAIARKVSRIPTQRKVRTRPASATFQQAWAA